MNIDICTLCGKTTNDLHNGEPITKGRVCGQCNETKVIPARVSKLRKNDNLLQDEQETEFILVEDDEGNVYIITKKPIKGVDTNE